MRTDMLVNFRLEDSHFNSRAAPGRFRSSAFSKHTRFGKEKLAKSVLWSRFRSGCGGPTAKVIAHSHGH
ncbi:hypothetical protein GCM10023156_53540 [Novipirellula rosea]|uniref:Uncharacterized protein n=1 Tax=Novipirellula rosea TaxID=1031540 RepID=A0ABP8NDP8_9BACT